MTKTMKTTYKYLLLAGLVVLAASCEKEIEKESPADATTGKMITETISAQIDDATKATVDADAKFAWTVGDKIAVHVSSGEYIPTAGASVAANEANFAVTYVSGYTRDAFAIFPSNIVAPDAENYGQAGHTLDVTLPSTYPLAAVSGEKTPCPMIATNIPGAGWTFSQLCGLLRLTLNNLPPSTRSVTIGFNGQKVQGAFSIASPVSTDSFIETAPATGVDAGKDVITINTPSSFITGWTDGLVVNIPVPTGTYTNITVTSWTAANGAAGTGTATLTMTRPINWTVESSHGRKVAASLPAFSINASTRVAIAGSNLQATTSNAWATYSWSFMEYPWSQVETADVNVDYEGANTVSLFGWGTAGTNFTESDPITSGGREYVTTGWTCYHPYITATTDENYGPQPSSGSLVDFTSVLTDNLALGDWGVKASSGNGSWGTNTLSGFNEANPNAELTNGAYKWRTPSREELQYLLGMDGNGAWNGSNTTRKELCGFAVVNGINGLIIVPDNFCDPKTNTAAVSEGAFIPGCSYSSESWGNSENTYSSVNWNAMAEAGAVFLPASGYRDGTTLTNFGTDGRYWLINGCSSLSKAKLYKFLKDGSYHEIQTSSQNGRRCGMSVRLIRDLD